MSNNNLELALRVRADVAGAVSQLNSLQSNITQTGRATSTAQNQSAQATNQTTQAINRQAQALENASDSLDLSQEIRQTQRLGQAMSDTAQATQNTVNINERMEQSLRSLTPHFMSLIGLSGGLLTASLNALEKSAQLKNLSNISGMNVEQFQYFAVGAKSVGIEMDKLSDIFKDTRDKVGDFLTTGGGELTDFFEQIAPQVGVTAEQFRHLSGADALQLYVNSLREANVSENEMIFYMESIADEASALLPLLNEGGEGFRKYGEQARQAGAILSQTAVNDALKAKSAISEFSTEMQGVGNRIIVNMIPALQFVAQHFDTLAKAGIIVASVFAGRMTASFVATTIEMIKVQATTMATAVAQARLGEVSLLTATRLNALTMASRLLTSASGLIGLGVAVASIVAGFLLMRKSSDEVATSLDGQTKSVAELKNEYNQLSETQKRIKITEQLDKINELTQAYHKQSNTLKVLVGESLYDFWRVSGEQKEQVYALVKAYNNGTLSAEALANEMNKLGFVSDDLKRQIDEQAVATATAKSEMDNANHVLSAYQGKTLSATSATNGLSDGLAGVGNTAQETTAKISQLSKQYQDLMAQTKQDIFELSMVNNLIQKGYSPEQAQTYTKMRIAKGSELTADEIRLADKQINLKQENQRLTSPKATSTTKISPVADLGDGLVSNKYLKGLKIKSSEATAGGQVRGYTAEFAQIAQQYIGSNLKYFSAFNDKYHQGRTSDHNTGKAFDIVLKDSKQAHSVTAELNTLAKQFGYNVKILNEYAKPSKHSIGGHIHVSVRGQGQAEINTINSAYSTPKKSTTPTPTKSDKPSYQYSNADIKAMQKVQSLVRGSDLVKIAQQHGVPVELLEALMMQESRGEQYAKSHTGALGYFQTTSSFRKQWGLTENDSYDLIKSGTATVKSLAQAFKHFGNWEDAIRSHNAGVAGTEKFNKTGKVSDSKARNTEVAEYVPKIAKWSAWFGSELGGGDNTGKEHLQFVQAQIDLQKQAEEEAKRLAEKREELLYQFASEPAKFKTDYDKKVNEIKSAGFDEQTQAQLLKQAEQEYQDKLTKRPEILQRALDSVKTLEQDFMQSTKTEHENNLYQIEHKYDEVLQNIAQARAVTDDPQHLKDFDDMEHKIKIIIDKEKLKAEYDNAMSELDKLQAEKQQRLDILQQRYDSTNMTAHEFHTQKTAIDGDINPQLQTLATHAQLLAQSLGDAFSVDKLNLFIAGLTQAQANFQQFLPTAEQLNDRITNGLTDAFFAFADGTKSAEEAFREFASTFFREIAQMILKQMIFNAISTAGKAGGGGWGGAIAGVIGSAFGGKGYSSGGYTGAGGKYEPAGIVHKDEFVIRKEMTSQVGAKEFLSQFNQYGMQALKGLQGYSSGGLVGASVPNISAPHIQAPKLSSPSEKIAQSTSFNANQNFYLVDDPSRILDTLNSSQGQENLVVMMSRDPEKFKTALRL